MIPETSRIVEIKRRIGSVHAAWIELADGPALDHDRLRREMEGLEAELRDATVECIRLYCEARPHHALDLHPKGTRWEDLTITTWVMNPTCQCQDIQFVHRRDGEGDPIGLDARAKCEIHAHLEHPHNHYLAVVEHNRKNGPKG